jgi:hypothetical protein
VPDVPTVSDTQPLRKTPVITGVSVGRPVTWQTFVAAFVAGEPTTVLLEAQRGDRSTPLPLTLMDCGVDATMGTYAFGVRSSRMTPPTLAAICRRHF